MPTTYEPIATTTLSASQHSITFSSIPNTYTDLVLIASAKQDSTTTITSGFTRVNGDTGNNYSNTNLWGGGSTANSNRRTSVDAFYWLIDIPTTSFTTFRYNFMNYSNTTTYKTFVSRIDNAEVLALTQVGLWRSTAAISSITITAGDDGQGGSQDNFSIDSTFTLYGIKAA